MIHLYARQTHNLKSNATFFQRKNVTLESVEEGNENVETCNGEPSLLGQNELLAKENITAIELYHKAATFGFRLVRQETS